MFSKRDFIEMMLLCLSFNPYFTGLPILIVGGICGLAFQHCFNPCFTGYATFTIDIEYMD